jgi:hypothetical protein
LAQAVFPSEPIDGQCEEVGAVGGGIPVFIIGVPLDERLELLGKDEIAALEIPSGFRGLVVLARDKLALQGIWARHPGRLERDPVPGQVRSVLHGVVAAL